MKAIFVAYNQAYNQEIVELLDSFGQRGYTVWEDAGGRGSRGGEPHLGSHAWPTQNHALLSVVEDDVADAVLDAIRAKDGETPNLGLRAFVWSVEKMY